MSTVAADIASYIRTHLPDVSVYTPTTLNGSVKGVLVEQQPDPEVDVFLHYERTRVTITVRATGEGPRGTSRAYEDALRVFRLLALVMDTEIDGTRYDVITAESAPYELYGGADYSLWKLTVTAEREIEA